MSARRNESGTASPSGRASVRQLQAHSCLVGKFTNFCMVQGACSDGSDLQNS